MVSSANFGFSAFSLSVMFAIMQTSRMKGRNEPSSYFMISKWIVSVCNAYERDAWDTVKTGASSSGGVMRSPLALRRDSATNA